MALGKQINWEIRKSSAAGRANNLLFARGLPPFLAPPSTGWMMHLGRCNTNSTQAAQLQNPTVWFWTSMSTTSHAAPDGADDLIETDSVRAPLPNPVFIPALWLHR